MAMSVLERAKVSAEMASKMAELRALPVSKAMQRASLSARIIAIMKSLGANPATPAMTELAKVAAGQYDGEGLSELLQRIEREVPVSDGDDAQKQAHDAITHWAKIEEAAA